MNTANLLALDPHPSPFKPNLVGAALFQWHIIDNLLSQAAHSGSIQEMLLHAFFASRQSKLLGTVLLQVRLARVEQLKDGVKDVFVVVLSTTHDGRTSGLMRMSLAWW